MPESRTQDIGGGFSLVEADSGEFARFHAIYRPDPFLRDEPDTLLSLFCEGAPCQWVTLNGTRVGGCLSGGGVLGQVFTMPPFERRAELIRRIALHMRRHDVRRIFAHGVTMDELDDFFRVGFRLTASLAHTLGEEEPDYSWQFMRAMVRPTQLMPAVECGVTLRPPRKTDASRIAALLADAYGQSDPMRQDGKAFSADVAQYFLQGDRAMRAASSLATKDGRLLGACLVVRWENAPLLFDIAVHPDARMGGIARAMVSRALSELALAGERRMRLFVECGNPAESLYNAMGFFPGPKTTSMVLD